MTAPLWPLFVGLALFVALNWRPLWALLFRRRQRLICHRCGRDHLGERCAEFRK